MNSLSQDEDKTRTLAETVKGAAPGVFFGIYDDALRRLEYVSCGHNPALLMRANGTAEMLHSTVLAFSDGAQQTT